MTAREELATLAREHGWEVGGYPSYVQVHKTGFIRASVQIRVEWTEAGNVEHAERIAKGQPQVVLERGDRDKRATIASWLTEVRGGSSQLEVSQRAATGMGEVSKLTSQHQGREWIDSAGVIWRWTDGAAWQRQQDGRWCGSYWTVEGRHHTALCTEGP